MKAEAFIQAKMDAIRQDAHALAGATDAIARFGAAAAIIGSFAAVEGVQSVEASQFGTPTGIETQRQERDPVKNAVVGEAEPYTWFHPVRRDTATGQEEAWEYTYQLRDPNLPGASLANTGTLNEISLNGTGLNPVGVDVKVDSRYTQGLQASGSKPFVRLKAGPGDRVILMNQDNQPVAQATADDNGYIGIIADNKGMQFGIRIERITWTPIKAVFGNISREDLAKERLASEIVVPAQPPTQETPVVYPPVASQELAPLQPLEPVQAAPASPEFLPETPVYSFAEAPAETYFLPKSSRGEGWSHAVQFAVPQTPGITYADKGNVGEMFVRARNGAPTFDLYMKIDPRYINDYKQGPNNLAAVWLKTTPNALVQLLDQDRNVVTVTGVDGKRYPVQAQADGQGYAGVGLTDFAAPVNLRVVLDHPEIPSDTQMQFGSGKQADMQKPSTLDTNLWIPRP